MGERRGSKEQNNEDKSTVDIKSLERSTICVSLCEGNRNTRHGEISWCQRFIWNSNCSLFNCLINSYLNT